jgi:hypothetical protein
MRSMSEKGRFLLVVTLLTSCGAIASIRKGGTDGGAADAQALDGSDQDAGGGSDAGDASVDLDSGSLDGSVDVDGGSDAGLDPDGGTDDGGTDGGGPSDGGTDGGVPTELARLTLNDIAAAYRAFYAAELRWPLGASFWDPRATTVAPTTFASADTALFSAPSNLPACSETSRGPCWEGPFLPMGTTLGLNPWLDPWGQPFRFAMVAANTGLSSAPQGAIVLWSVGADGLDQTGCTTPVTGTTCTVDQSLLSTGAPSAAGSDDIAVVITPAFDPATSTQQLIAALTTAFDQFHSDTGLWPYAGCGWDPNGGISPQIEPFQFVPNDDVLAQTPNPANCSADIGLFLPQNWSGSYLWSDVTDLASGPALDGWGNPLMFALIRPADGFGGGVTSAPDGAILIWSTGPDGIDQTGCSTGACGLNVDQLAKGHSSGDPSDDIISFVGPAIRSP